MDAPLLERDAELAVITEALDRACGGTGSVVLLSGEAGIGKTSVVRAFLRSVGGRQESCTAPVTTCVTPRTLGPLRDAARAGAGELADALAGPADRDAVLTAVLDELSEPRPTVLVVEDVHWADDATLDVLRYVGRRIDDLPALLVVTYRDDEIAPTHPLAARAGRAGRRRGAAPAAAAAVADGRGPPVRQRPRRPRQDCSGTPAEIRSS